MPLAPANDTVATVIAPSAKSDDADAEALEKIKPNVEPGDTLETIERKVGAKKAHKGQPSNDFTPNLIQPTQKNKDEPK